MKRLVHLCMSVLVLTIAVRAFGSDQQKAENQLRKITAMATDPTGRRVVSITVANILEAKRVNLVLERRAMNVNYGDLFVAHILVRMGARMEDIAAQLNAGRNIGQIANAQHADWKQLAAEAKKLNATMENNLYKHFVNATADTARDVADGYDPNVDGVAADNDVSRDDIADAERVYKLWRDRAAKPKESTLDASSEKAAQAARGDPVRAKAGSLAPPKY
jgi:hypothetical protein